MDRIEADLSSTKAGDGQGTVDIDVAIVDGGIYPHRDLNVVGGYNCLQHGDPNDWADRDAHGTHVAGTVAAKDDGVNAASSGLGVGQVVGVAPSARLWAVRVMDPRGHGSESELLCGIDWVTSHASTIKVANMSLTGSGSATPCGPSSTDALHLAICKSVAAGVTYVVAAGNRGKDLAGFVPAAYPEVLTATAMTDLDGEPGGTGVFKMPNEWQPPCSLGNKGTPVDDTPAFFSNVAAPGGSDVAHTIAAPGVCVIFTALTDGYLIDSGTSMAAPHVTGAVALCIAHGACRGLTPAQIITKIIADARARPASYRFKGDPNQPDGTHYYGPLVYAGGY